MLDLSLEDWIRFLPDLLQGAKFTIAITVVVYILACIIALLVVIGRMSRYRVIRYPLIAYVEFIRSTPTLVQIYYIFYIFPAFGLTLGAITAGIVGLSLHFAAYMSEVFRGAILAIPKTQGEAATTIGLSYFQSLRFVILPQALRAILPTMANYLLGLFKETSLLSVITIQELMFKGLLIVSVNFKHLAVFTEVAVIYFVICYPVALLSTFLEHRLRTQRKVRVSWRTALKRMKPGFAWRYGDRQ